MGGTRREFARALDAARSGDPDGFVALWRSLDPVLVRYLRITCPAAAGDVGSATWVKVAQGLECFPADEPGFRGLLVRVARDESASRRAAGRRRPDSLVERVPVEPTPEGPDDAVRLVGRLPVDVAEMLALRIVVGLPTTAVAEIVGVRAGAVRVAVQRGLRRTADALTRAPAGASGLLDPWALDRILDEGELGVSRLDPAMRSLVTSLTTFPTRDSLADSRPDGQSDLKAARRAFARTAYRTRGFVPVALLAFLARRGGRAGSLLGSKGVAVVVGTLVLSAPAAVAYSAPVAAPPAAARAAVGPANGAAQPSANPFGPTLAARPTATALPPPPPTGSMGAPPASRPAARVVSRAAKPLPEPPSRPTTSSATHHSTDGRQLKQLHQRQQRQPGQQHHGRHRRSGHRWLVFPIRW